jgi:hypothetical protein
MADPVRAGVPQAHGNVPRTSIVRRTV